VAVSGAMSAYDHDSAPETWHTLRIGLARVLMLGF
jgi:hypothetical protein